MTTEILGLDEIVASQAQKEVPHNTALRQIEAWVRALSITTTAPPATPAAGDTYIVPVGATGVWAGQENKLAHYYGGSWKFRAPIRGPRPLVLDEGKAYFWNGTAWAPEGGDTADFLTQADADAAYEPIGAGAAAVAAHVAETDPHPDYLTQAEADALYAPGVSLSAVNVFTKNQSVASVSLGSGVSPAIDAALSNNFKITLGANNTLVNPTNLTEGMVLNFAIDQDATGGRTLTYGSLYKFPGGTVPTLSTAANAKDFMSCYYDGSILRCQMNKGFA